jgi:hypothetical protein
VVSVTTAPLQSAATDDALFDSIETAYGLTSTSSQVPTGTLSFQDLEETNAPFAMAIVDLNSNTTWSGNLLPGPLPSFTVTFPQQLLPWYAMNPANEPFQNVAFYADVRRTYFVVNSPPQSSASLTNPDVAASADAVDQSFYFFNHYHPWVGEFIKRLNGKGISCVLSPCTQALIGENPPTGVAPFEFSDFSPPNLVNSNYPEEIIDFGPTQKQLLAEVDKTSTTPAGDFAYSIYNWEIFFHVPVFIAIQLSQNQQFDDAETWFRYIFNPTRAPNTPLPQGYKTETPKCYWNFKPLNAVASNVSHSILANLLKSASDNPPNPLFTAQLAAWQNAPFEPDVIAQFRPVAYQKAVVMKYLDHLIRRGDYCFSQNTRESIYESIQYYILADQILGKKPVVISQPGVVLDQTYSQLRQDPGGIYGLGNANVQLENAFPFVISGTISENTRAAGWSGVPPTPYFCTPNNPTLLAYYDTVADRLYKIRHCMNIQGQVEQLPLFSAPINPGLLVAAEAAGVDLSSVLGDIAAAVPHYRFSYMYSKALELCAEVRSLGAALLSALEKSDAEGLSLLRAGQEVTTLQAVLQIKQLQIQEANANLAGLQATQAVTTHRQAYYQGLIQEGLSEYEIAQITATGLSELMKVLGCVLDTGASGLALIPQVAIGINGAFGSPSVIVTIGGEQTSKSASASSRAQNALAESLAFGATLASMLGGWDRRSAEWQFQLDSATLELAPIAQQIAAASFRVQVANQDLSNQNQLIVNAQAIQSALQSKFTNQDLYQWMVGQVSAVFFQCYQMAYDLAKRAEACYRFELGIPQSSYIQFGYWDSLKKGLMAGEKLYQDLKRLEIAYIDQNLREYEISKSISLLTLDPSAFVSLKLAGLCLINLPEAYFDMDYPGHYMRRIRSISLTIPCVTGPYTSVNCTLSLLQSRIRFDNTSAGGANAYPENPIAADTRFSYNFSATESIATSTAQNDSGLFEVNFRDERYLPFEGSGVVSQWQLSMPPDCNAFDFESISDVILNLRYSARNGGDSLRKAAKGAAVMPPVALQASGALALATFSPPSYPAQSNLQRYFNLRHEYPTEWYQFLHPSALTGETPTASSMQVNLDGDRFPFQYRSKPVVITAVQFILIASGEAPPPTLTVTSGSNGPSQPVPLNLQTNANPMSSSTLLAGSISGPPQPASATQGGPKFWTIGSSPAIPQNTINILMVCTYSIGARR